jgi:hypothetical protein
MSPFQGDSPAEIMKAHPQSRVLPIRMIRRDLPLPLTEWLMTMLARDGVDRPEDEASALEALQKAIALSEAPDEDGELLRQTG